MCTCCKGIWFDSGELLGFVRNLAESEKISPEALHLLEQQEIQTVSTHEDKTRLCPECGLEMQRFNYACDSNIFLDKCTNCDGIWTDRGEVLMIAEYIKINPGD